MASNNKAELIITGKDETGKAFVSVDKKLSLTQKKSKALGLGFEALTKRTGRLSRGLGGLVGPAGIATLALVGIVTAVSKALTSIINFGDELDKTSKKLGITSEQLQLNRRALEFAGVASSSFEGAILAMNTAIGQAGLGTARAVVAFEQLGISMSDLSSLTNIERFELINKRLSDISDSAARAAVQTKIYGGNSKELNKILGENAAAFNLTKDAIEETATFLSNEATTEYAQAKDNLTILGQTAKDTAAKFFNFLSPAIRLSTEIFAEMANPGSVDALKAAKKELELFVTEGVEGIPKINELLERENQLLLESKLNFQVAAEAGGVLFRGLNDGIGQFIDGNLNLSEAFSKMTLNILADLAKMIVKFAILNTAALVFNSLTGGAAASGVGFAGGLAKKLTFDTFYGDPLRARASGGPVSKGNTFLVGEKGPELFTPNTSGSITPNSRLGGENMNLSVNVELINNTGQNIQGEVISTEQDQNSESIITRIVLTDMRNSGPISRGMSQRFGLASTPR